MNILRHYVPSFFGDVSLTATGPKSCVLVAERLTIVERGALEALTKTAIKRGWCQEGTDLARLSKTDLAAPLGRVSSLLASALKPGRTLVTAVRFRDGRMEEMQEAPYADDRASPPPDEQATSPQQAEPDMLPVVPPETAEAVTVAKPFRGCPAPDFAAYDVKATRVLNTFLNADQREDFARFNRFVTMGADTGHRYMITSRHNRDALAQFHRQMYDLDDRQEFCVHDDTTVPAAEELLGLHVCLSLPGWETVLRTMTDV